MNDTTNQRPPSTIDRVGNDEDSDMHKMSWSGFVMVVNLASRQSSSRTVQVGLTDGHDAGTNNPRCINRDNIARRNRCYVIQDNMIELILNK